MLSKIDENLGCLQRVNDYAYKIINDEIPACQKFQLAAGRHLSDLENSPFTFNEARADHCLDWLENVLKIDGKPFRLPQWQTFFVGNLMGWCKPDGTRKHNVAVSVTGKSSAKSTLSGALALYLLSADRYSKDNKPHILISANTAYQGSIILNFCRDFIYESPSLSQRVKIRGGDDYPTAAILRRQYGHGRIERVSSDRTGGQNKGKSGTNLTAIFSDELGELHREDSSLQWLWDQRKNAIEPILFITSNPSVDKNFTELGKWYKRASDMLTGIEPRDNLLAMIAELDEESPRKVADLLKPHNRKFWYFPNPGLGDGFPRADYLESQLSESKGHPVNESQVMRVNFGQFAGSQAGEGIISPEMYDSRVVKELTDLEERRKWEMSMGLDLSQITQADSFNDLSSLAQVWTNPATGEMEIDVTSFISGKNLAKRQEHDGLPWNIWAKQGHIIPIDTGFVDYDVIASVIQDKLHDSKRVKGLAYDPYYYSRLRQALQSLGIYSSQLPEWLHIQTKVAGRRDGQEASGNILFMPKSIHDFMRIVRLEKLKIKDNPVTRAAFLGVESTPDVYGNLVLNKQRPKVKIDPAVAGIQAIGLASNRATSKYAGYYDALFSGDLPDQLNTV